MEQVCGVAAEDLLDAVRRKPAVAQQSGQVGKLPIAGQDRLVVTVQVGADGHVGGADRVGEPDDLGGEVGQ